MKLNTQNKILTILSLCALLCLSCGKESSSSDCVQGTNPNIWHKCLNKTLETKENYYLDLNDDNNPEMVISYDKTSVNEKVIGTNAEISLTNSTNYYPRFDFTGELKKGIYYPSKLSLNANVDSTINNWILKMNLNISYMAIFNYFDGRTSQNPNLLIEDGIINQEDVYIGFRYYETEIGNLGWKNGWIKLNATKERLILKEIAYHKTPETKIKVGEK